MQPATATRRNRAAQPTPHRAYQDHARYDKLNRLIKAETTGAGGWGLSWTYDGFGNREQQTNLKGSVPVHSVNVNKLNNRIDSPGYQYDANGNMTQMPLMTMSYDVANRMVSSDHSSQGVTTYRYNHANQRIYMKTGTKISYFLYGLGGERLLEMEEQCGGNCWNYQETQRWIYFAGRKMFSRTGTTLKAVTPNRLASEAKHFPYGETDGPPPSDTKDYFATYRRDTTGLDYAWNRYYSPTMGRFTTADPYVGSINVRNPQSWNRYGYTENNPVNAVDSKGLACHIVTADIFVEDLWDDGRTRQYDYVGAFCSIDILVPDTAYLSTTLFPTQLVLSGVERASMALSAIADHDFSGKEDCLKVFDALASIGGKGMDLSQFIDNVKEVARLAAAEVYDGNGDATKLDSEKFPGVASDNLQTVGDFFSIPGVAALSQYNGYAIFVDASRWSLLGSMTDLGTPNKYGLGTMLHEVLHKQRFGFDPRDVTKVGLSPSHRWFEAALEKAGISMNVQESQSRISRILGELCF